MSIEKIKAAAERYQKAIESINHKRQLWNATTEQFIFDTLVTIKNEIKLDWAVRKVERMRNLESVELSFNDTMSGISEGGVALMKTYKKMGGKLIFTQSYSGEVLVLCVLPFIQELTPPAQPELLDRADPEDIDAHFVTKHIPTFIEKLAKWEGSDEQHRSAPIGFNRRNEEEVK
jgi:hypothetical protein